MSLLKFIKDKEYDTEMISIMLQGRSEEGILEYAQVMNINTGDAKRIARGDKKLSEKIVDKRYSETGDKLDKVISEYQKGWDEIDEKFFKRLAELTKFPLAHKNYECVVSLFHPGISNWGGNKVARIWNKDFREQRRITAHELVITQFFSKMRSGYPDVPDQITWKLAEIYAFAITGLDPVLKSLWPWDKTGAYTDHNYPELVKSQKELTDIAIKDINEFIERGLSLLG